MVIIILKGGVPDNDFNIQKWSATDRGGKSFQYNPRYKEESLSHTQNPVSNLAEAKSSVKEWYDRRTIYLRLRKQGHEMKSVKEMLEGKGMI